MALVAAKFEAYSQPSIVKSLVPKSKSELTGAVIYEFAVAEK